MTRSTSSDRKRLASVLALTTGVVTLFVALGGVGVAQSAISAAQYQYGKKVTVCHKGKKTISIGRAAVPAHLRHGDTVGTCASARAKAAKAKAAKAKAAKAKAAKAKAQKAKSQKAKGQKAKAQKAKAQSKAAEPTRAAQPKAEKSESGKSSPGRGKRK